MTNLLVFLLLLLQVFLLCCFALIVYLLAQGLFGVPFVRSPKRFSKAMLDLAKLQFGETVVDFGSGDGSIVIHAATAYGARGIGFEHLLPLVVWSRWKVKRARVADKVHIRRENFLLGTPLPKADVITSYLFPEVNAKLEPLLKRDYPSGTRVVSRTFLFPTLPLKATEKVGLETVYLYEIP